MSTGRFFLILGIIFLFSFGIRYWATDFQAPVEFDEFEYFALAEQIRNGNGFVKSDGSPTAWRTPGFPLILTAGMTIFGNDVFAARVFTILISSLTTIGIAFVALAFFRDRLTAVIAAAILAIHPTSITYSGALLSETSAMLGMMFAAIISMAAVETKSRRNQILLMAACGLLCGYLILIRGFLIPAVPAFALFFLVKRLDWRGLVACSVLMIAIPFVWLVRNHTVMGPIGLSTQTFEAVWYGCNPFTRGAWNGEANLDSSVQKRYLEERQPGIWQATETDRALMFRAESLHEIGSDPGRFIGLAPKKIAIFLNPNSYLGFDWNYLLCLPLGLGGLLILWKRDRMLLIPIVLPVAGVAMMNVVTFGDTRFRQSVAHSFVILASVALVWIYRHFAKSETVT